MKKDKKQKKNLGNIIIDLIRDALFGGSEYSTVKGETTPFPIGTILGVVTTTTFLLALIFSLISTAELSADIANLRVELVSVAAKADTLKGEFSRRYPFTEIQAYAEEYGFTADGGKVVILPDEEENNDENEENFSDAS